jgi:hypothetical protein
MVLAPLFVIVMVLGTIGGGPAAGSAEADAPGMAQAAPGAGETAFIGAMLDDLGAPATAANVTSMQGWILRETPWPPAAENNPMNTTLPESGSTPFNFLPGGGSVQNYPTATEGAAANASTIASGSYPQIAADLRAGVGLCSDPATAGEFLTWSGGGYDAPVC